MEKGSKPKEPNIEIRLTLEPGEDLFKLFNDAKRILGIKGNADMARVLLKKGFEWIKKNNI